MEPDWSRWVFSDTVLRRYLVGDLPSWVASTLEKRYTSSERLFERLEMIEDRFIDDYLRGELDPRSARRFERYYPTTDRRRRRILRAQLLQRIAQEKQSISAEEAAEFDIASHRRLMPLAAAALAVLLVGPFLYWSGHRVAIVALDLTETTRARRDAGTEPQIMPREISMLARTVQFRIRSIDAADHYAVSLRPEGAQQPTEAPAVRSDDKLVIEMPSSYFSTGTYVFDIRSLSADGSLHRRQELRFEIVKHGLLR